MKAAQHRKRAIYLILLGILCTFSTIVSCKMISYRRQRNELRQLVQSGNIRVSDPLPDKPFFIFSTPKINWSQLVPNLEEQFGAREKKILGTFDIPGQGPRGDVSSIEFDQKTLRFPAPGEYYLHTNVGFFKILILSGSVDDHHNLIDVARFVSGNCVHSLADWRKVFPVYQGSCWTTDRLLKPFFASDQPLKVMCGGSARMLALVFSRLGCKTQLVHLEHQDGPGHFVIHVYAKDLQKYFMVDADYGAIVLESQGVPLSIQEIAMAVRQQRSDLTVLNVGQKSWLKSIYNPQEPTPQFAWSPDKMSENRCVDQQKYIDLLHGYTNEYTLCDRLHYPTSFRGNVWDAIRKFSWNGERIVR